MEALSFASAVSSPIVPCRGKPRVALPAKAAKLPPPSICASMEFKTKAQAAPVINGTDVKGGTEERMLKQLPDFINTVFSVAEKQLSVLQRKTMKSTDAPPPHPDTLRGVDLFGLGMIVENGQLFKQNFIIRSYEIGADRTASIETVMNHLQESCLNHMRSIGLQNEFGATPEMTKRDLIWVVAKMQVLVDHYPSWGEAVEVDTWIGTSGKNGIRREWIFRDSITGQIIARATSVWVMMNKHTRKLSKIPDEVRRELDPYCVETVAIDVDDKSRLAKITDDSASQIQKGLTPKWGDLDGNQHVNNVKYLGWILESTPVSVFEKSELASMTLEYRRECGRDSVIDSVTSVVSCADDPSADHSNAAAAALECRHLLRLSDGAEVLRGRTAWRQKRARDL